MSFNVPGDLALSDDGKDLLMVVGPEQLRQALDIGLKTFQGSWIYDPVAGVPYLQTIFVKGTPLSVIRQAFHDYISAVPGVVDIPSLELTFDSPSATLSVEFKVSAEDGSEIELTSSFAVQT